MREIKFRAWDKTIGYMCDVYSVEFLNGGINVEGTGVHLGNGWVTEKNGFSHKCDVVLMQYTGLKDKNGQEIYEGDVIDYKYPDTPRQKGESLKGVVEYVDEVASFRAVSAEDGEMPLHSDVKVEIIGNIYENPELLDREV